MPHRVLHIQQDHPAQAEQECGHAAVPQDAIWCPINADEVRYVDVLREHGKDVVNNFGDEEDTDRYNAVLRDIDGDVPEVDINAIKHLVEAKRRDAQLTHKDRIVPKIMSQTGIDAQEELLGCGVAKEAEFGIWNKMIFGDGRNNEAEFMSGVKVESIFLRTGHSLS